MTVTSQTIQRIKAVADDPRGDPATRAVARRKLEEITTKIKRLHPPGYYSDRVNWKENGTSDGKFYSLMFYMLEIRITGSNWKILDPDKHELNGTPKYANGSDSSDEERKELDELIKRYGFFGALFHSPSRSPKAVQDIMQEVEHCMIFEGLEERLKARVIYEKDYQTREAMKEVELAKEGRAIAKTERQLKRVEKWIKDAEELLRWAQGLKVPEE
jgi:hypothetical protein